MNKFYVLGAALLLSPLFMNAQSDCTPHMQVSNNFENGLFNETGGAQKLANDFTISANTTVFNATSLTANLLTQEAITSVDLKFYVDADGAPGEEIIDDAITGLVPTSQDSVGNAFGYAVREVVLDFPAIEFLGNGTSSVTYWVQLSGATATTPTTTGQAIAWEVRSTNIIGNPMFFQNTAAWTSTAATTNGPSDAVFSISGECTSSEGCLIPENVTVSNPTTSSIEVMWSEVGTATEWIVEYGVSGFTIGSGTEITDNDGTAGITISDLDVITTYDVYVKSICGEDESAYSGVATIATMDDFCGVPVSLGVEAITKVEFAGLSNVTNAGSTIPNEYFLDSEAMVNQDGTFPITLEGFTGGDYTNTFTVFIDWNQNMDFTDAGERYEIGSITNSTGVDGMQATGNIEVPADATLGSTRMRVVKLYTDSDEYAPDACSAVAFGQTEDYTVIVDLASALEFAEYEFKMGPNPTKDFVNISATETIERVAIYNLLGQQVYVNTLNVQSPQVDLSSFENGVYMMAITIKGQQQVFKVVKQ